MIIATARQVCDIGDGPYFGNPSIGWIEHTRRERADGCTKLAIDLHCEPPRGHSCKRKLIARDDRCCRPGVLRAGVANVARLQSEAARELITDRLPAACENLCLKLALHKPARGRGEQAKRLVQVHPVLLGAQNGIDRGDLEYSLEGSRD